MGIIKLIGAIVCFIISGAIVALNIMTAVSSQESKTIWGIVKSLMGVMFNLITVFIYSYDLSLAIAFVLFILGIYLL